MRYLGSVANGKETKMCVFVLHLVSFCCSILPWSLLANLDIFLSAWVGGGLQHLGHSFWLTWQFVNKPTCGQSSCWLVNLWTT